MNASFHNSSRLFYRLGYHTSAILSKGYRKRGNTGTGQLATSQGPQPLPHKAGTQKQASIVKQLEDDKAALFTYLKKQTHDALSMFQTQHNRALKDLAEREKRLQQTVDRLVIENRDLYTNYIIEKMERGRWDYIFNMRGVVEKITDMAVEQEKITGGGGVQSQLNRIIKSKEFQAILPEVLAARGVRSIDVRRSLATLYAVLSRDAHGNDGKIVLRELYLTDNELAGLVALLRVQRSWKNPLPWREEPADADSDTGGGRQKTDRRAAPTPSTQLPPTGQPASSKALQTRARKSQ
ncbi:hypothetical protein B9Z19DRAFT_1063466 [Tuber borchii]|uniref:Uncharacterized protein n=1 Tax=Tuber borchii TaxID=42251 RepID=A0A2T6ZY99_TUBBO|nr:hypothetical protein B9Z19DRAFT_1063466 [Tuber borchii]